MQKRGEAEKRYAEKRISREAEKKRSGETGKRGGAEKCRSRRAEKQRRREVKFVISYTLLRFSASPLLVLKTYFINVMAHFDYIVAQFW